MHVTYSNSLLEDLPPNVHLPLHPGVFKLLQAVEIPAQSQPTLRAWCSRASEHGIHTGLASGGEAARTWTRASHSPPAALQYGHTD